MEACAHTVQPRRAILFFRVTNSQRLESFASQVFSRERLRRVLRKKAAVILHLHTFTSADLDLHTLTSADLHLHTFTPADLHLHTLTPADLDLHTFTSADLEIFTPSHLQI